jgi:hypothetical protein
MDSHTHFESQAMAWATGDGVGELIARTDEWIQEHWRHGMVPTDEDLERVKRLCDQIEDVEDVRVSTEKLVLLAQAYKEGLEAGGQDEAERRMREKFDELNPVYEATDEQ